MSQRSSVSGFNHIHDKKAIQKNDPDHGTSNQPPHPPIQLQPSLVSLVWLTDPILQPHPSGPKSNNSHPSPKPTQKPSMHAIRNLHLSVVEQHPKPSGSLLSLACPEPTPTAIGQTYSHIGHEALKTLGAPALASGQGALHR